MQELSYMSGEQPLFRQKRSLDDDLAGIGKKRKRSLQDDLAGISGKRSLQDDLAGLNAAVPATPPDILGGTLPSDATNVVKPYNRSEELLSNLPGEQVPERPWSDAFMPGILPKGTTENVDRAITNIKPSLFGQQEIPENLSAQEKGRRTMHNIGVKGTKFAPGLLLGALENPIGTAGAVASFLPELAQRLGKAGGVNLKETLLNPTGAPGMPFIPQQTTEQEQKAAQQETLENMFDVILAASPLLGKVKGLRKTGETISKQKTGVKYDKESQGRLSGSERVGQEPRRPIPDKGTGGEAAERSRVLQTQKEVTPSPVKAKESWEMTKAYHGTEKEFDKFDYSKIGRETDEGTLGRGFYFDSDKPIAEFYAKRADRNNKGGVVLTKYLDVKNPFVVRDKSLYKNNAGLWKTETLIENLRNKYPQDKLKNYTWDEALQWLDSEVGSINSEITNFLKGKGYDAIEFNKEFTVFDVKSIVSQKEHKKLVRQAISEGKPVPAEVLKDYPDLAAKYGTVQNVGTSEQVATKPPKPVTSAPQSKQIIRSTEMPPEGISSKQINKKVYDKRTQSQLPDNKLSKNEQFVNETDFVGKDLQIVPKSGTVEPKKGTKPLSLEESQKKISKQHKFGEPTTLSFMGVNPTVAKQLGGNVVKGIEAVGGKITPPLLKQAQNRVKLPESKQLFKEIERADELWHRQSGQSIERLRRLKLQKLSDKEAIKLADEIENPKTHNEYNKALDVLYYKAKAKGVKMGYIGKGGKRYFPRVWKEDALNKVFDDLEPLLKKLDEGSFSDRAVGEAIKQKSQITQKLINHLIETKQAKSYTHALKKLQKEAAKEIFPESSFEKGRTLDLPSDIYERNAKKVLPQYVDNITKRIAQIEIWGEHGKGAQDILSKIREKDFAEGETAGKVLDMWSGQYEMHKGLRGTARKVVDAYMGFESTTKIGLGTATIPNITQSTISSIPDLGAWNTVKGGFSLLTSKGRSQARQTGMLRESMIDAFAGREPKGFMGKVARKTLTATGFMGINKFNLYLAASSFRHAVKGWHKAAQNNTIHGRWARKRLGDLNLKHTDKLNENLIREKAYRFAVDSQLQRNVLKDPIVFNDPVWRPLFLFKRFGYRQATYIKDMLWRETIHRGNPMPLLRLVAGGILGGEFVIWAKNQIKEQLTGEPYYRKDDKDMFKRICNDLAAVGSFGMVSDMMEIENLSGLWSKAKFLAGPVFVSDAEKAFEALTTVTKEWEKYGDAWLVTKRNANRLVGFFGSLPRYASKRMQTAPQKKNRLEYFRGRERTDILDLMLNGRGTEASRRIQLWNQHHKGEALTADDINSDELYKRAVSRAETLAKAKGTYIPKSTSDNQGPKAPSPPSAPKGPGR